MSNFKLGRMSQNDLVGYASAGVMELVSLHSAVRRHAEASNPWMSQRDRAALVAVVICQIGSKQYNMRCLSEQWIWFWRTKADSEKTSQWTVNGMNGIPKQQKNDEIQAIIDAILGSMDDIKICDIQNNHISNNAALRQRIIDNYYKNVSQDKIYEVASCFR